MARIEEHTFWSRRAPPTRRFVGGDAGLLRPITAVAALAAVLACVGPIEPRLTVWDASIEPLDPEHPAFAGSLGAVADERVRRTETSVAVQNAPPDGTLPWRIRSGACAGPGEVVGAPAAYPDLTTDETGSAESAAVLGQALRAGQAYVVEVWDNDETGLVGCGSLMQR